MRRLVIEWASINSGSGQRPSIGISERRCADVGAPSETIKRKWCPSAVKRRMAGTMPAVEIEIAFAEIAPPAGSERTRAARMTLS